MDYRWDELLDGHAHLYRAGRDFNIPPARFAELITSTAQEFGLTAVVTVDGQFVAFQAARAAHTPAPALSYGADEHAEEIARRHAAGESFAAIGRSLGVPWQTARRAYGKYQQEATADAG